jgi:hypothetical protein
MDVTLFNFRNDEPVPVLQVAMPVGGYMLCDYTIWDWRRLLSGPLCEQCPNCVTFPKSTLDPERADTAPFGPPFRPRRNRESPLSNNNPVSCVCS